MMSKKFWIALGLLVVLIGIFLGVNILPKPTTSADTRAAMVDTNSNNKLMVSLESFKGSHHDAEILLEKLTVLKAGLESAIATKDIDLLKSTVNNTYRIMDNVNTNRLPTIAPFEVCDDALDTLGLYAVAYKTYYSNTDKVHINQINKLKNAFNSEFTQCQNIVNDKPVETLYQDYQ